MARWKENDRVHVIDRPVTLEDRKSNRYFEHMVGQVGTVQAVYGPDEVAVKVDPEALSKVDGVAFSHFDAKDVVRHPLVQRIVQAYEARTGQPRPEPG